MLRFKRCALGFVPLSICLSAVAFAQDVGLTAVTMPAPDACGISSQDVTVTLNNPSPNPVSNIPINATISGANPPSLTTTFAGPLAAGASVDVVLGQIDTFDGGSVDIDASTALANDPNPANDSLSVTVPISPGRVPIVAPPAICPGTAATIQVGNEPAAQYEWYAAMTGGAALAAGATYTTPALTAIATYYVERINSFATAGLPNMSAGTGAYLSPDLRATDPYGLIFNVLNTVTLTSVTIYTNGTGNVVVRLLSDRIPNGGQVLQTATGFANVVGANTIPVNFTIPPGTGYILDLLGTVPDTFRINSGVTYPMTSSDGNIVITGQTFNTTNTYYYWFFDWQIGSQGCADERTAVTIDVDPNVCMADLQVTSSGPPTAFRGGTVVLSSQITNLGPDVATGVSVTGTPPTGVTFVSNAGACTTAFPCALGDMDGNTSATIDSTFSVPVNYSGPALLAFNVDGTTTETDPNANNDGATVMVTVVDPVDLSVQVVSTSTAQGGLPLSYDVTVTNAGPGVAVNPVLALPLDPLFTGATTSGCNNDPAGVPSCTLANIPAGGSVTVSVVATTNDDTTGNATLSGTIQSDSPDSNGANDTGTLVRFIELISDLSVAATIAPNPIVPGGNTAVMTVTVTNVGPSASSGGVVTTMLPAVFASPVTNGCDEDPLGVPTCTLTNAPTAQNSTTQFTITDDIVASATGMPPYSVMVTSNDTDQNAANDAVSGTITLRPEHDLLVGIVPPRTEVVAGGEIMFEVFVTNDGPSVATNATLTTMLPPELAEVTTVGCAEDPAGAPTCDLGTIQPAERKRVAFTAMVTTAAATPFTTRVEASADGLDPQPSSNTNSMTLAPTVRSDIVVTLTGSQAIESGDEGTYTLRIEAGPADAQDVVAQITLPSELTLVSTTGCDEDPSGVPRCAIGAVSVGAPTEVTITVLAGEVAAETPVTVQVSASTSSDGNDAANDAASVMTSVIPPTDVDLSLTATIDPSDAEPGDSVTLALTVANAGPGAATNVRIAVTIPEGVTLDESRGCFEDPSATTTCTLGLLNAERDRTARLDFTIDEGASGALVFAGTVMSDSDEAGAGDEDAMVTLNVAGDAPDAGVRDGGGGIDTTEDPGGCGCTANDRRGGLGALGLLVLPFVLRRRRER